MGIKYPWPGFDIVCYHCVKIERANIVIDIDYSILAGSIDLHYCVKDENSVFIGCNQHFAIDAGFSHPDEIMGKTDDDMPWFEFAELYRAGDRVVLSGQSYTNQLEPHYKDSTLKPVLASKYLQVENGQNQIVIAYFPVNEKRIEYPVDLQNNEFRFVIDEKTLTLSRTMLLIMKYIILGYTAKRIASKVSLSFRTVEKHIAKLKTMLCCRDRTELIHTVWRNNIGIVLTCL